MEYAESRIPKLNVLLEEFEIEHFSIKEGQMFCKLCKMAFKGLKRQELKRHCNSKKHRSNVDFSVKKRH